MSNELELRELLIKLEELEDIIGIEKEKEYFEISEKRI